MKIAMWVRLGRFPDEGYERARRLVMTAAALAAFVGFQIFEAYFFAP
jgi:hypothetical protein